jgi:hypothetical protein
LDALRAPTATTGTAAASYPLKFSSESTHHGVHRIGATSLSLRGFLNLLENGSGLRYTFEDDRYPQWRGLQFNKWRTTTQGALIWLHKACHLRYRFGADGRLIVRFAAPVGVSVPCGDGAMPISPQ